MSKQQDELREQIHILLIDYDHAGMWQGSASKQIMKLVNSAVQSVLDKVKDKSFDSLCVADEYAKKVYSEKPERAVLVATIEEVRKDYE